MLNCASENEIPWLLTSRLINEIAEHKAATLVCIKVQYSESNTLGRVIVRRGAGQDCYGNNRKATDRPCDCARVSHKGQDPRKFEM